MPKRAYLTFLFIILISGLIVTQNFYDQSKERSKYIEPSVLQSEIVKFTDFGLHNAAADISWLSMIQYFGGNESKTSEKTDDYLFLTSELDPKFSYPYAFGVLVLPGIGQPENAIILGEKGLRESEPDWRIPYYMAATYHINLNDSENAAKYFDIAAHTPGAPENIIRVAATYGSRPDLRSQTKLIWEGIYENSKDEVVKERAYNYLLHFSILDLLEEAARKFKERNNRYPKDPAELVSARIIKEIPTDPFGFKYKFNSDNGRAEIK